MQRTYKFCVIFLLFTIAAKAQNPCDIAVSVDKGCVPLPVQYEFKTTNTSTAVSYLWHFGDGDSSVQSNPTHAFTSAGSYVSNVTVIFQNGTQCTVSLPKAIVVYHNPLADFVVNNNQIILLCARGNAICFADKSSQGAEKAPIVAWQWNFGDGQSSTKQNPCYAYSDSGYYQVTLQVTDSNGCTNTIQKIISVRYTTDVGLSLSPKFSIDLAFDCVKDIEVATFKDSTDTAGQYITKFIWNFGDGTKDSCDLRNPGCLAQWTNFQHIYSKAGNYHPSLYIENKYGCSGFDSINTPIIVQPYKLVPTLFPSFSGCFTLDSMAEFIVPPHPLALGYYWDYGDPYRRTLGFSAGENHIYEFPGVYTIHIDVVIGKCHYDSTICDGIKILGPIALIMPVKGINQAWDSVPPNASFLISPSKYASYFDTSCAGPGYSKYYTYTPTVVKNGESVYDNCKVDTIKKYDPDSLYICNGKKIQNVLLSYKPHVDSYKDTIEQFPTLHYWYKGSPFPTGNLYSAPPFVNRPLYMDDTSLFSLRCQAPQKITFTNFSDKYRGYYEIDNFPLDYPSKCLNKDYPYASDSLTYLWDFKEGSPNTSTQKNPVTTDRYSTEKLPTHLFQKDGCYWVILTTSDTMTNCSDKDSIPVVLEAPDAGWAPQYSNIKNMTSLIQDSLPANGPRRGMIISGKPCLDSMQTINLNETLPSCYKRDFNMVLDSVAQEVACGKIVKFNWLNKDTIVNYFGTFEYTKDTGWKTIGLVVTNNYNCTDTVWYHDYKYIHGLNPSIGVSTIHSCLGDTLKMWPFVPQQLGIKTFTYYFAETLDYGDTIAKPKPDTIRYRIVKQKNGTYDTITSTVHNRLWGIDDSSNLNFNYLTDTTSIVVPYPGHFTIMAVMFSRFGCVDTSRYEVTVGDYVDFASDNTVVCTNDTVHFQGIVQYFLPFHTSPFGYDTTDYWRNPDSARNGHKPKIPEKMEWDFNGDGIIDATGPDPYYVYTKGGSYTVTLYTTDSNGCSQTLSRPNYIKVIGDSAFFTIAAPGDTRYCTGSHFFQFVDSSHIIKPFKDSLNLYKIYSWTWDFGDGAPPLVITDSSKKNAGHLYIRSGDYIVKLVVRTAPGTGATTKGCADSFQRVIHILGPSAGFSIIGTNKGCVPFTVLVLDQSNQAKIREWILGDGTTVSSYGGDTVRLTYMHPGTFCPQFFVADTLTDSTGKPLYCSDIFPDTLCQIKVVVYDTNKQVLTASDTLICLGTDSIFFKSAPDTGYTTWTLNFGDGESATKTNPQFSHLYTKTGKYHAVVSGSGAHCPDTASINIHVIDIKSLFSVDTLKNDTPNFSFKNLSVGGVRYTWDFGDGSPILNTTSNQEINHIFQKAGKSTICLTAYNEKGCFAKYCDTIHIDTSLFIPNVFTPNGDTYNPDFNIKIYGSLVYQLDIYNRWGQRVFHSDDKNSRWDGTNITSGSLGTSTMYPSYQFPDGTYYYVFQYRFIGGKNEEADGAVTVIR